MGNLQAADFYWRGDNGNWNDGTKWFDSPVAGAARNAVPTAADNVFFNANSFSLAGQTVVVDVAATCLTMSWTGATNTPTITITNPLTISGGLTFIPGMTVDGAGLVTFAGTGALNLNMSGQTFGGATVFNNATGNWTLTGAFATAGSLTLTAGALTTGGATVACSQFIHNTTQAVNLGTSIITISGAGIGAGTAPFETTSAGTFTSTAATFNFTNIASVASEVRLGTTVRTYGNFIFAAPAATTKSIAIIGAVTHTLGAVTLGGNVSLTTPTNDYTFASLTAGSSTEPAVLVNLGGNSTFTGLVNMGNNTGFQTAASSTNSFAAVTIGASTLAGAGAVNFNGTNTYAGVVTLANNAIVSFNDTDTFNAGITGGNDVTVGFSLNVGNAAAQTTFATAGTVAFGDNLRGATAANIFSRRNITSSRPFTFGNNAGNGAALNWCENSGVTNMNAATAILSINRDGRMNFKGVGNNTFQAITATDGGTGAGNRNLQFMNTGTLSFTGAQNFNSLGNTVAVANTVTTVSTSGATTYGRANAVTFGNTGTLTFTGNLTSAAGTVGPANTTFNVNNSVGNVVITGTTNFGDRNLVNFNQTGLLTFSGAFRIQGTSSLIVGPTVTNVQASSAFGDPADANNTITFNNTGTLTLFGSFVTGATNTLTVGNTVTTATFFATSSIGNSNTVNFNNSANLEFQNNLTMGNTLPRSVFNVNNSVDNVLFGSTGGTLNLGTNNDISFANTGTLLVSNPLVTGGNNTLVVASTVTTATFSGAATFGANNTVNFNNTANLTFSSTLTLSNSVAGSPTTFNVNSAVDNFTATGNASLGNFNNVTLGNSGPVGFGGTLATGTNHNLTIANTVTNVTATGTVTYGAGNTVNYNNNGTIQLNGNVTYTGSSGAVASVISHNNSGAITFGATAANTVTATAITGSLTVNFTNTAATTYNSAVTLATASGTANSISYNFAGGRTATISANFTVTGACNNLISINRTGAGVATLTVPAIAVNRNWVRANISNLTISPANNIRAYAYVDGGGNTGIDFRNNSTDTNRTLYWVAGGPQGGTSTLWSNTNNWSFAPDEFVPAVCIPTIADSVVFGHHDISFSSPNRTTVDVDGNYPVAGMRWSITDVTPANPVLRSLGGATRTLTLAGAFDCFRTAGNVTFENESAANRLNFTFTAARRVPVNGFNDIRSGGVNFPREVLFNGNADNSRWRLITNFSARIDAGGDPINNGSVYLQRGEWWCNGQDVVLGRFNTRNYGELGGIYTSVNFTAPHRLEMDGDTDWTIQGRTGNLTGNSVPNEQAIDLQGNNFTFNAPSTAAYFYFTGASLDSTNNTEGQWVNISLGRNANVARTVPGISVGNRHNDIDISVDGQATAFVFRNLYLHPVAVGFQRQIFIQTWNDNDTQLIFTGPVDFSNNTNQNPANDVGTVIRSSNRAPNATWSNVNRFERTVTIGNNSNITFWGNYRFMAPVNVAALGIVTFERSGGGTRAYRFDADVTLGQAVIANFRSRVSWPVANTTLSIGSDAIAYVGDVPSTTVFPNEYGLGADYNNWQNIVLGSQGRLILNNGEGSSPGPTITNDIVNLTFGEFSIVELNTELNTATNPATPRTRVTGTMSSSFAGVCSSWATLRSVLEGKQADLIVNSAQTVNALVVKDVRVVENVAGIDVTINAGADAGNNSGVSSLSFSGSRTGRNFYWVGGTNKNKIVNTFRRASDTDYDGINDDNGDNVNWSNPANWYTEPEASPVRTGLTVAMITFNNQCVPTIIDNVYFINDGFIGGTNTGANVFVNRRNVLMDIPQGQAKNFIWNITTAAFTTPGNAGIGFIPSCVGGNCAGPAVFTNEQQPILPTTEMQIAGNLQWSAPGAALSTGTGAAETVLRNNYLSRFAFIGQGSAG